MPACRVVQAFCTILHACTPARQDRAPRVIARAATGYASVVSSIQPSAWPSASLASTIRAGDRRPMCSTKAAHGT